MSAVNFLITTKSVEMTQKYHLFDFIRTDQDYDLELTKFVKPTST